MKYSLTPRRKNCLRYETKWISKEYNVLYVKTFYIIYFEKYAWDFCFIWRYYECIV